MQGLHALVPKSMFIFAKLKDFCKRAKLHLPISISVFMSVVRQNGAPKILKLQCITHRVLGFERSYLRHFLECFENLKGIAVGMK